MATTATATATTTLRTEYAVTVKLHGATVYEQIVYGNKPASKEFVRQAVLQWVRDKWGDNAILILEWVEPVWRGGGHQ